jgi:type IV secretion system protein VirD4
MREAVVANRRARLRELPDDGLLIGRSAQADRARKVGFAADVNEPAAAAPPDPFADLVIDRGEGHIMAIAPTGAGKGVNVIMPALLSWKGPSVTIDVKGEAARAVAPHLVACGHDVQVIDLGGEMAPILVDGKPLAPGAFNVMETLDPDSPTFAADCHALAVAIPGGLSTLTDRFWDNLALALLIGVIGYLCTFEPPEKRNFFTLRAFLSDPDLDYTIAVKLDTVLAGRDCFITQEFKNYLGHEREKVRTSVRSTAIQHLTMFAGDHLAEVTSRTTFDLSAVTEGRPLSIFFVIPPHRLESSATLLRLYVSTLLGLITRRRVAPPLPTLFVLDELAQLGPFPMLRPLVTLMRGYGVRAMLLLQDPSQLRQLYPNDYQTIGIHPAGAALSG